MEYGLVGENVVKSFSKIIHEKMGYSYNLLSLNKIDFESFLEKRNFKGINVTIPYKEFVLNKLDYLSNEVKQIGACNLIVNKNNLLYGYNTDYEGFKYIIEKNKINLKNKKIAILGSGGSCKTVIAVLQEYHVNKIYVVSRNPKTDMISYNGLLDLDVEIIINTTPNGMIEHNDDLLLDLSLFNHLEVVIDIIYNPFRTRLLFEAKKHNISYYGGLDMLVVQALKSSEYFLDIKVHEENMKQIINDVYFTKVNIILIGFPGTGKTKNGRQLATLLNKKFLDLDEEIERIESMTIKQIFLEKGEHYFRTLENSLIQKYSYENNFVISCGGGVVLNEENMMLLNKNGILINLERNINNIPITAERPLMKNKEDLEKLFAQRRSLYRKYADINIYNCEDIGENVLLIKEKIYEFINR